MLLQPHFQQGMLQKSKQTCSPNRIQKSQGGFSETLPINLLQEPDQPGSKASRRKKMNLPSSWYLEDLRDQEPRRPPGSCRLISPLRCATVGTTVIFWGSLWDTLYRTAGCYGDVVSISTGNTNIIGATRNATTHPQQSESWCISCQRASWTKTWAISEGPL